MAYRRPYVAQRYAAAALRRGRSLGWLLLWARAAAAEPAVPSAADPGTPTAAESAAPVAPDPAAAPTAPEASAPAPAARAAQLHQDAERALAAGDRTTACPLYEASQALDPSATTQARIAQCLEHDGKLASALRAYEKALLLTATLDETRRRLAAERFPQFIAQLEPRVPRLEFVVAPELGRAEVRFDGAVLTGEQLAAPLQVDPGPHVIAAGAAGFPEQSCALRPSEGAHLEVRLEARAAGAENERAALGCSWIRDGVVRILLGAAAPAVSGGATGLASLAAPSTSATVASGAPSPAEANTASSAKAAGVADRSEQGSGPQRTAGFVIGGVGAASLALATYFGIRTLALVGSADCNDAGECSDAGMETMESAERSQTAGFITAGAGVALLAGGLALVLSAPRPEQASQSASRLGVGITPNGVWMRALW